MRRTTHGRSGSAALAGLLLAACATGAPVPAPPPTAAPSRGPSAPAPQARCQLGYATACRDLGRAHLLGDGVPLDDRLAAALVIKACEMGESGSCSDLSVLSALGRGVAQDDARAAALARRSCTAGFALGCSNLGVLAAEGVGRAAARPGEAGDATRQL